jgi:transposase-like protein
MVKCPYCGFEGSFKELKRWKYSFWDVYLYECPDCNKKFRYQIDLSGKRKAFVMRLGAYARSPRGSSQR